MRSSQLTAVSAVFLFILPSLTAQIIPKPVSVSSAGFVWSDVSETNITARLSAVRGTPQRRDIVPQKYRTVRVDKTALKRALSSAAPESAGSMEATGLEFDMPYPAGGSRRFLIQESSILDNKLAARYPELKTYVAQSVDDPATTARIDMTPRGFHAIILSTEGQIYIDPYSRDTDTDYISYFKRDLVSATPFACDLERNTLAAAAEPSANARSSGATLKTYRLALACTGEYAAAVCSPDAPTVGGALAAMVTSVNRVSAIYERDFAIRFQLVGNTDKLIFLDPNNDPYSNTNGSMMLGQNQATVDSAIGSASYDFGHVLSTGGGGVASLGVICVSGMKARGVTGSPNPVGDPYDVDYVAHEMGHQFGANHSFDGTADNCSGNGNLGTAYEPGSGTTIMAYAGICSGQNLAAHSDDYFHTVNYDEISTRTADTGNNDCAQMSATGNTPPTIGDLSSFTIPAQTPFALTATATDPDGDALTYCWEEFDRGPFRDPTTEPRDNGSSPLFRSFRPSQSPVRYFPSLTYILNNQSVPPPVVGSYATGEFLPTTTRIMTFRITVRDNHPGGGGTSYSSTTVTSMASAGPFAITSPNSGLTIEGGSQQIVTWKVGNTNIAPVNCANVRISLSIDGGTSFPIVLADSVPNNGTAAVTIPNTPNIATTQGRIKIEAVGNIFFDISDANLTLSPNVCAGCASPPVITSGSPPSAVVLGTPYTFGFSASGNPAPGFAIKNGSLPAGLTLFPNGALSGTVTAGGGWIYPNIVVAASNGNPPEAEQMFSLTIVTRASNYLGGFGLNGAAAAWNYDYDLDGLSNLAEYGLMLNPTEADVSTLPVVSIRNYSGTNYLSMTFHRSSAATDLTYTVQASGDLVTWTDLSTSTAGGQTAGTGFVGEIGAVPNLTVEVRDTVPLTTATGSRRFLRLRITSP